MSEATIINLASGEAVTEIKPKPSNSYCMSHCKNILVDGHLRQLTCRECGAIVDPWNWIVKKEWNMEDGNQFAGPINPPE